MLANRCSKLAKFFFVLLILAAFTPILSCSDDGEPINNPVDNKDPDNNQVNPSKGNIAVLLSHSGANGSVAILDLATGESSTAATIQGQAYTMTKINNDLFIPALLNQRFNILNKVDLVGKILRNSMVYTSAPVTYRPSILAHDGRIIILNNTSDLKPHFTLIDPSTLLEVDTVRLPGVYSWNFTLTDNKIFVDTDKVVTVLNASTLEKLTTVSVGASGALGFLLDKDNQVIVTASRSVINPVTYQVTFPYPDIAGIGYPTINKPENIAYILSGYAEANNNHHHVAQINLNTKQTTVFVPEDDKLNEGYQFVRYDETRKLLFVGTGSTQDDGTIRTFDAAGKLVKEYKVPGVPRDIAFM